MYTVQQNWKTDLITHVTVLQQSSFTKHESKQRLGIIPFCQSCSVLQEVLAVTENEVRLNLSIWMPVRINQNVIHDAMKLPTQVLVLYNVSNNVFTGKKSQTTGQIT